MAEIHISRSRTGVPVIGVGGGAYSNTFIARTVIRKRILTTPGEPTRNGQYSLLAPMFVKRNGHLCCDQEQAIVPVKPGDIVVHLTGSLPAEDNNPEAFINGEMITAIDPESNTAMTDPYPLTFEDVPVLVIRGTEKYHNRDGRFFCDAESAEGDNHE